MFQLEDYREIVSDEALAAIHKKARKLLKMRVIEVNSTYEGGGVVELLSSLVPLMHDTGVDSDWRILMGDFDFFTVTKQFHNALQGAPINLTQHKMDLYESVNRRFATFAHLDRDIVVIHDPQPLPLIRYLAKGQPWVWRCHIDLSHPDPTLWHYLKGFILRYDVVVVSHPDYIRLDLPVEQRIIMPAIDPLTLKNQPMSAKDVEHQLKKRDIPLDKPLVTQISRFDPWKDPEGVLEMYELVRQDCDCRLVLCGGTASDDPEGAKILANVRKKAKKLVDSGDVLIITENSSVLVNALQRKSAVIVQKSLREGFGLTVTEAMWKGTPVLATRVGGIPLQISDGVDGYLINPTDIKAGAEKVLALLKDKDLAKQIGDAAKETVRQHFLITRMLSDHLDLMHEVLL
jgi:trehalose synthase